MDYFNGKTIKIPVRVINGKFQYFYGGDLSFIKEGTIGELTVLQTDINDEKFIQVAQSEQAVQLFEKGTALVFGFNGMNIPEEKLQQIVKLPIVLYSDSVFVEVILLEPLKLIMRGSKKPVLDDVRCIIPSLKIEADSLNTAYSKISTAYEPKRRSHSGNVFNLCFYMDKDSKGKDKWYPLEEIRQSKEGEFEQNLFLDYKIYKFDKIDAIYDNEINNNERMVLNTFWEKGCISGKEVKKLFKNNKKDYFDVLYSLTKKGIIK